MASKKRGLVREPPLEPSVKSNINKLIPCHIFDLNRL